jgi:folate-binding protein YgfZ
VISWARSGTSAKKGAEAGLPTMVKRAPGISSVRRLTSPEAATASAGSGGAMKRIEKGLADIRSTIALAAEPNVPYAKAMTDAIALESRALVTVRGPDWRSFLQNLLTCDVEGLQDGEARFGALLTPQGRLLYDLFLVAEGDGCVLDVETAWREGLVQRLMLYRLRAKVEIATDERAVAVSLGGGGVRDPRLAALGGRLYGVTGARPESVYEAHRLSLGVPGPADWGTDRTYPLEADFDLLNGVDFQKGCFVGQETTSRMKRRAAVKNRMLPVDYDGDQIAPGTEVLAGTLRAGEILSGSAGRSIALVRLDRIEGGALTADGRSVFVVRPEWFA